MIFNPRGNASEPKKHYFCRRKLSDSTDSLHTGLARLSSAFSFIWELDLEFRVYLMKIVGDIEEYL